MLLAFEKLEVALSEAQQQAVLGALEPQLAGRGPAATAVVIDAALPSQQHPAPRSLDLPHTLDPGSGSMDPIDALDPDDALDPGPGPRSLDPACSLDPDLDLGMRVALRLAKVCSSLPPGWQLPLLQRLRPHLRQARANGGEGGLSLDQVVGRGQGGRGASLDRVVGRGQMGGSSLDKDQVVRLILLLALPLTRVGRGVPSWQQQQQLQPLDAALVNDVLMLVCDQVGGEGAGAGGMGRGRGWGRGRGGP